MFEKLNEKDKKTIRIGAILVGAAVVLFVGMQGYGNWQAKAADYTRMDAQLNSLNINENAFKKMLSDVPVFQMPKDPAEQKTEFRDSLDQLCGQLGITTGPWQDPTTKGSRAPGLGGYGILQLKTNGSCRFDQILNLLAALKNNPYLLSVEELNIECDPQNPQQAKFVITLSTLTNNKRGRI